MNNLGLWYRAGVVGGFFIVMSIPLFLLPLSIYLRKPKLDKLIWKKKLIKGIIVSIISLVIGLGVGAFYSYKALYPNKEYFVGTYEYYHNASGATNPIGAKEYTFSSSDYKKGFYIDSFNFDNICEEEFVVGEKYLICYDKETKIVLKASGYND